MAQIPIAPESGTVAPLPNENSGMQIFKNSHPHWDSSPSDMLAEFEISIWG
jgi:hypothetical protein